MKFGLRNTEAALTNLGEPQRRLRFAHVAGTNGKGSVCAMLEGVLRAAGLKTGLYTSPHLTDFRERIQVRGRWLPVSRLSPLISRVRRAAEGIPLTFFEFATVMALEEFARRGVEAAVLEVGMGGRLDATNIVSPEVCVITNVSREHTEHLGRTVRLIAAEKAGIIKPNVPVVTAARGAALEVIEARSRELGAPLLRLGRDFGCRARHDGGQEGSQVIDYHGLGRRLRGVRLGLAGHHQAANAALALAAAEIIAERLGRPLPEEAVRRGLAEVSWPGRLERLGSAPLLLLDGAHNPAGARALAAYLSGIEGRLILVVGMLRNKDSAAMLRALLPLAERLIACAPKSDRALPAAEIAAQAERLGMAAVEVVPEVGRAVFKALELAKPDGTLCVCGSLYTVGEAREWLLAASAPAGPGRRAAC
jgi:dihydrofolate synthase/folylpolyglutamate synthase